MPTKIPLIPISILIILLFIPILTATEIKEHYEKGILKTPSIQITKTLSTSTIQEGQTATVTLTITNNGVAEAKDLKITDSIPSDFKLISGANSKTYPTLKPRESRTFQYSIQSTSSGTFALDPATATYSDAKGNSYSSASNSITIAVGIIAPVSTSTPIVTTQPIATVQPTSNTLLYGGIIAFVILLLAVMVLLSRGKKPSAPPTPKLTPKPTPKVEPKPEVQKKPVLEGLERVHRLQRSVLTVDMKCKKARSFAIIVVQS